MNKNKISDNRKTLDAKHKDIIKEFKEKKKTLPQKKKKLLELKKNKKNNDNDMEELYLIDKEIEEIETEIHLIENNTEEEDYYLKTSDLLFKYYCPKNNLSSLLDSDSDNDENQNNLINKNTKNIHYYFNQPESQENSKDKDVNKAKLLDKFLLLTDDDHIPNTISQNEICDSCQTEMEIKQLEGIIVCTNCGNSRLYTYTSNKPSYKESIPENNYFAYKRINHFNEWLSQFQAKESTEIPTRSIRIILLVEIKKV